MAPNSTYSNKNPEADANQPHNTGATTPVGRESMAAEADAKIVPDTALRAAAGNDDARVESDSDRLAAIPKPSEQAEAPSADAYAKLTFDHLLDVLDGTAARAKPPADAALAVSSDQDSGEPAAETGDSAQANAEAVPEPVPEPEPEKKNKTVIHTSYNGPRRDVFDDVDGSVAEENDEVGDFADKKSYVLCFVERSGSTMLTDVMKRTKLLGRPTEYVNPRGPMYYELKKYPAKSLPQYFNKLRHSCSSPNGVFGMKTIFEDFKPLLDAGLVSTLLGTPSFIYLTRKDVVLQAISSYLARKRDFWHSSDRTMTANVGVNFDDIVVEFDRDAVIRLVDRFLNERTTWERFFCLYGIEPLRIEYEDLVPGKISHEIKRICEHVGIEPSFSEMNISTSLEILRDERNAEWAKRIRDEFKL
jgi:LPS sulfotransferase NodH